MAGSNGVRRPGDRGLRRRRAVGGGGFTLVELLVVIAIIALLLAIMVPSIVNARELAFSAACKVNLHFLSDALNGQGLGALNANTWIGAVGAAGAGVNMKCPKHDPDGGPPDLTNVFILQHPGWFFSNVQDLLEGKQVPDEQVVLNPPGIMGDDWVNWNPPDPGPDQALICVDDDAAVMITFTPPGTLTPMWVPASRTGSDHWVVRGDGSGAWQNETVKVIESQSDFNGRPACVLVRLTGVRYPEVEPPVTLGGPASSYAMNDLVDPIYHAPGRVMLVEYNKTIAWWGGSGNYLDEVEDWAAPRHLGMANIAFVDGSVGEMSLAQLEEEREKGQEGQE